MRIRNPDSFAGAVRTITDAIGTKRAANEAGVSASLVYKWADPGNGLTPYLSQATALDMAYQNAMDRPGPIYRAMAKAVGDVAPLETDPGIETLEAVDAVGRVAHSVRVALADNRISPNEYGDIAATVAAAKRELGDVANSVRHRLLQTYPSHKEG